MTKIEIYSVSAPNDGSNAPKGTANNPYTESEYESMVENGTWPGGYVEGLGYCLKEVVVDGSRAGSDSMDSDECSSSDDSWPSDDS
ncbi:MAG: hypothetical protein NC113_05475 [Bacteroides sp.]|nr:hypothetical protein [Bacteroides sp.]MCM1447658.1 hypothetical protein [Bacteroides sp.]